MPRNDTIALLSCKASLSLSVPPFLSLFILFGTHLIIQSNWQLAPHNTTQLEKMGMSSWKSLFMGCVGTSYQSSTVKEKKRQKDSSSASSSNSICDIPFSSEDLSLTLAGSNLHEFTFAEIKTVTRSFSNSNFIGSGGFGPVFKGFIPDKFRPGLEAQHVAVKYLDQEGTQGHREWMVSAIFHTPVAKCTCT
jgi:hypothetical protein